MTGVSLIAALDFMKDTLDAAGVKYSGVMYDDYTHLYEVWLPTDGYVDKHGEKQPHWARLALRAALLKAGYAAAFRRYELAGGEYYCRFVIEPKRNGE